MYSEEFRKQIVAEYREGKLGFDALRAKYGIGGKMTIQKWVQQFDAQASTQDGLEGLIQEQAKENAALKQQLEAALIREAYYQKLVELGEEQYGLDLKKKSTGKRSRS